MQAYADKFFNLPQLEQEWKNENSSFYFAEINNEIVGYMKLNRGAGQTDVNDDISLEVERIYVSRFHQGKQIGRQLLSFAIQKATSSQLRYLWLGVWEHNNRAIQFYQGNGFQRFGQHDFMLGNDLQVDVLMRKEL